MGELVDEILAIIEKIGTAQLWVPILIEGNEQAPYGSHCYSESDIGESYYCPIFRKAMDTARRINLSAPPPFMMPARSALDRLEAWAHDAHMEINRTRGQSPDEACFHHDPGHPLPSAINMPEHPCPETSDMCTGSNLGGHVSVDVLNTHDRIANQRPEPTEAQGVDFPNPSRPMSKKEAASLFDTSSKKLTTMMNNKAVRFRTVNRQSFIFCSDDLPPIRPK